jgi:hypothetical protein
MEEEFAICARHAGWNLAWIDLEMGDYPKSTAASVEQKEPPGNHYPRKAKWIGGMTLVMSHNCQIRAAGRGKSI